MYFANPSNNPYQVVEMDSDHLVLAWTENSGLAWIVRLIAQGYVQPTVSGTMTNTAAVGGTGNLEQININLTNPSTSTLVISNVVVTFGDGKDTTISANLSGSAPSISIQHRYMLAGTYTPSAVVTFSGGTTNLTGTSVTYASNDPSYTPPPQNLNAFTVYDDFNSQQYLTMYASANGGGSVTGAIVTNPNSTLMPNKLANCYEFTKSGSQYGGNYLQLPGTEYFDLTVQSTFTYLVYGTAGNQIVFTLDDGNGDYGTSTIAQVYTIQNTNEWEQVTVSLKGVGNQAGSTDVTTDPAYDKGYYKELYWQIGDGNTGDFTYYLGEVTGPVVPGMK